VKKARFAVPAVVVVLACVGLIGAAIPAGAAGGKVYKTTLVSLARGDEAIEGKISSPKAACLGHRLVRAVMNGHVALGTTFTDGSGKFSYTANFENAPPHLHFGVLLDVMAKDLGGDAVCERIHMSQMVH
jgi:hypothetical protein